MAASSISAQGLANTKKARIDALGRSPMPASYAANSRKEELCLEYVENFRVQFTELFPRRRPLLLTALNEAGVEKFICTTVRPTLTFHRELYDYKACAEFLADFIQYEPLADPECLPAYLPSPTQVLKWRVGDAFDMSIVLTSLLIGAGYDAYCVCGTAPKFITTRDTSQQPCPFVEPSVDDPLADAADAAKSEASTTGAPKESSGRSKYHVEPKPSTESKYVAAMSAKADAAEAARKREEDGLHLLEIEKKLSDEAAAAVPDVFDGLKGRRLHAWVLVRAGKRGVDSHVFIEPSTGVVYPVSKSPYEAIETVWNHRNFWVNMQCQFLLPEAFVPVAIRPGTSTASRPPTTSRTVTVTRAQGLNDAMPPSTLAKTHFTKQREAAAAAATASRAPTAPEIPVSSLSYDFKNADNWEYVFIDTSPLAGGGESKTREGGDGDGPGGGGSLDDSLLGASLGGGGGDSKLDESTDRLDGTLTDKFGAENVLDLPKAWPAKLFIDRDLYMQRFYPSGARTTWFYKAKLEQFAPKVNAEGLLARLSTFTDVSRADLLRVVEVYGNRSDKLVKRVREPLQLRVEEYFAPGRPSGLRQHVEVLGHRREMVFYVSARIDGLRRRVELLGTKVQEWYEPGPDNALTYRSATLMPASAAAALSRATAVSSLATPAPGVAAATPAAAASKAVSYPTLATEAGELPIVKMTEKFARTPSVEASADPARITYNIEEQTISVVFHHAPGRITASSRVYSKATSSVEVTTVDPFAPPVRESEKELGLRDAIQREKDCISAVKNMQQRVIGELLKLRAKEESAIELETTAFDIARERAKAGLPEDITSDDTDVQVDKKFDFLAPFLQSVADPSNITKEEAKRADHECRKAMRARLVERVSIIQRRLDEENEKLQKKQQEFQRNRDQVEGAEEEFEKFCAEAMFRIGILEQRLQRHEETVITKYKELEMQLMLDPRLAVLYNKS